MTLTAVKVLTTALNEKGDIYHFHDPELIPVGLVLKLRGKSVIYDVHESVPKQILSKHWIPRAFRKPIAYAVAQLERGSAKVFDGIVTATPGIASSFPPHKTVVVQNFVRRSEFESSVQQPYSARPKLAAYVGGLTVFRGVEEMVEAVGRLEGARLVLAGKFHDEATARKARSLPGWANVDEVGWLDRPSVVDLLGKSRVGLLVLHPEPNYLDSYPVKLFEYMLAGIPVVASDFPFWNQFVADTGCGIMVDPLDVEEVADAIRWLFDHPVEAEEMGRRGKEAALAHYSWESQGEKLVDFYNTILGLRAGRAGR